MGSFPLQKESHLPVAEVPLTFESHAAIVPRFIAAKPKATLPGTSVGEILWEDAGDC